MRNADSWPLSLLSREATRNVLSGRARLFPLVLAAVLAGVVHVGIAVQATTQLDSALSELETEGRHLYDITVMSLASGTTAEEGLGIDRASCENLAALDGVRAAGVITEDEDRIGAPQTGSLLALRRVSPSLLPAVAEYDVVIGTAVGARLGLNVGDTLELGGFGEEPVTAIVGGARALPSTLALFTAPLPTTDLAATCRVELTRYADFDQMRPVLLSSVQASGGRVEAQPLLRETADRISLHLDRVDRYLPFLLGLLGGLITAILAALRSAELATYRLAGTSRRSLGVLLNLEAVILAGVFLSSTMATVLVLHSQLLSPVASVLAGGSGACAWVIVTSVLTVPILRKRPSDMAKDR